MFRVDVRITEKFYRILQSLTALSVAGCGRLQLGLCPLALSVGLLK